MSMGAKGTLERLPHTPLEDLFENPPDLGDFDAPLDLEELEEALAEEEAAEAPAAPPATDAVRRYLQEIGSYPLLSLEEEVELARLIQRGQEAAKEIAALLNLSEEKVGLTALARVLERPYPEGEAIEKAIRAHPQAKRLYQEVRLGERARVDMVNANLRLVVSVAKGFMRRSDGLEFLDLIQEGNRGLVRATYSFDWRKRYKFSTYATWWIRQSIGRAIADQGRIIRLPVHFHEAYRKLRAAYAQLEMEKGRTPTPEELAAALGGDWTPSRVWETQRLGQEVYSLDAKVGEEEEDTLGRFLADETLPSPEEVAMRRVMVETLERAIDALGERQAILLRMRMGLLDGREYTLEEVGRYLGVTRERVRQLEKKALRTLRYFILRNKGMQEFLH
ncbi:sigma-70 family RNA polymerase sigma factor [Thermus scotoductus]|uniref:RNA polymerase subunit sigma-70 n=1 Tax=Thermus scotoductus TaxID=37636 RepID=A0A430QYF7_THESC|nr:sigma-70 family RNA polymerase sigma factor [Thermus scotoductus]RTG97639.1 RNA polymerase subunit sigma-70 [Thermus scotoductus]RTH00169.1 RNA polymerase subunit sigma-70 [Thermus scotoductus]RTH21085.1 RNA polymerase subunit sigma-70 [Thermus scotoductus]RTH96126.1 RNA polymerase subunit sigma-70 [Thermus scotoductus]RTI22923.1 RNA polymerase subunit sigma-70 [Thermus scotoductus]